MKQTLLLALARFGMQRYRLVFGCCIVLAAVVITLFVLSPPHIESDVLDLLPTHNPIVQDFKQATTDFKSLDLLFVLFETDDPGEYHVSEFEDFADELAHHLRESGMVEGVEYRLQDYQGLVEAMLPYTLLYLTPEELEEVGRKFTDEAIADQVAANRVMISNPASLLTKQLVQYDPFGLFPILKNHFVGKTQQLDVDLSDGYYISRDGRYMLMMVRPVKPAQNIPFGKELMARIRQYEEDIRNSWLEEGDDDVGHLSLSYGGGYPIAQDDANLIKRDAVLNTAVSVSLVLLIYIWAFRRKSALVYGWVPLIFGLLMTFGLAYVLGVTLNSATAGFGALLIGLGIDFSTVMYGRFIEERNRGRGVDASIASMMRRTGQGVFIGAITTAATFGAMILTEFSGMRQVGILTASGILVCGLCMFILLPAMLKVHQLHKTKKGLPVTFHMNVFGIEKLGILSHRHPLATLLVAGVAQIARVEKTIRQLLDYSKPWTPSKRLGDLRGFFTEWAETASRNPAFADCSISVEAGEEVPFSFDAALFEQVAENLVHNAAQAMPGGGAVHIRFEESGGCIRIHVADGGPGFSEDALTHGFEPFFTTKTEGAGLGLAVCRRILEAHGGGIAPRNTEGGAEVVLSLPKMAHDGLGGR